MIKNSDGAHAIIVCLRSHVQALLTSSRALYAPGSLISSGPTMALKVIIIAVVLCQSEHTSHQATTR